MGSLQFLFPDSSTDDLRLDVINLLTKVWERHRIWCFSTIEQNLDTEL